MTEKDVFMVDKDVSMVELIGSENYQSWSDLVDLWFIGNG